jgi:hypothetical protein
MKPTLWSICLVLLFQVFIFSGCNKTYHGEGTITEDVRKVGKFDKVALNMNAIVTVTDSVKTGCVVRAQPNILEAVVTRVDGNTLVITSKGNIVTDQPVEIEISMSQPSAIEINGSGEISGLNTLKNESFDFEVNGSGQLQLDLVTVKTTGAVTGSGEVTLKGTSNDFHVEINGSGKVEATEFTTLNAKARISGSGEVHMNVAKSLKANVSGSGIVSYRGDAVVEKEVSGSGEVRKAE